MGSKARILVVDDRERTVKAIERILQKAGYEVITAFDGQAGLEKARDEQPDLIILDIMMPGIDGYEVCRRLQRYPDTAHIPVVMLSGKGRVDAPGVKGQALLDRVREQDKGFESGAVEFLNKPIQAKELVEKVKATLWLGRI